jgi:hypothetical protein
MEARLVQDEYEIALAYRWAVKSIRAIQTDIEFFGVALQLVTGQAVDRIRYGLSSRSWPERITNQ